MYVFIYLLCLDDAALHKCRHEKFNWLNGRLQAQNIRYGCTLTPCYRQQSCSYIRHSIKRTKLLQFANMAAFVMIVISVLIAFSFSEADAQSTVATCEISTFEETARLIQEGFQDVKNDLREDLKAACASNQQQCRETELPGSKQACVSSFICK